MLASKRVRRGLQEMDRERRNVEEVRQDTWAPADERRTDETDFQANFPDVAR